MKKILTLLTLFITAAVLFSCRPALSYTGKDAGTTTEVAEYYSDAEVGKPFKVLGYLTNKVDATSINSNKIRKIQAAMLKMAKKKGADGIIYLMMKKKELDNPNKVKINIGGVTGENDKKIKNVVEAKLIKFK